MARRTVGSTLIICLFVAVAVAASPASLGSAFADSFTALAPLYTLHRAYSDHLFHGLAVEIPPGLSEVCADLFAGLADLHLEFIVQTDVQRTEEVTLLAHLRMSVAAFCRDYQEEIAAIAALQEPDIPLLDRAAEAGMFAAIFRLNRRMEEVFTRTLEGFGEPEAGWEFSAAFVIRTLIHQKPIERIDPTLKEILLGPEEEPFLREGLPPAIRAEIDALVALAGRDLTSEEQGKAATLTQEIHDFLLSRNGDGYDPNVLNNGDLYAPEDRILVRPLLQLFFKLMAGLLIWFIVFYR